jgi:hypothetical protein
MAYYLHHSVADPALTIITAAEFRELRGAGLMRYQEPGAGVVCGYLPTGVCEDAFIGPLNGDAVYYDVFVDTPAAGPQRLECAYIDEGVHVGGLHFAYGCAKFLDLFDRTVASHGLDVNHAEFVRNKLEDEPIPDTDWWVRSMECLARGHDRIYYVVVMMVFRQPPLPQIK